MWKSLEEKERAEEEREGGERDEEGGTVVVGCSGLKGVEGWMEG